MFGAFVTRNPLLPAEFYKAPELDKFVKKLNEEKNFSDFSLINCAGKYTVRVAVFRGDDQSVSWGRSTSSLNDEDKVSQLDLAAERAALTVRALRRAGYEAYQYHDRSQSYVTVGSFNELGTTNNANQFVYSDRIQEIISRFGGTKKVTRSQYGQTQAPTLLFDLVELLVYLFQLAVFHLGVDLCGLNTSVTEHFLDQSQIRTTTQQVRCEGMS